MFEPVIKWSGSKRSQAKEIIEWFPDNIDVYYEPFCGGCSVLRRLIDSKIQVKKYVCSDINNDLISLWNKIKNDPENLFLHYKKLWEELNKDDNKERKKEYFNYIRDRFNNYKDPKDFLFIMRTTTNGMPRYNKNGYFNNSLHITRNGIIPNKLKCIIYEWSEVLNNNNVDFVCYDYRYLKPNENDFVYLDPPYFNTKGMYYGKIDQHLFFEWLKNLKCRYAFSYNGVAGNDNMTYSVPEDLYINHIYIKSGNSSFRRVIGKSNNTIVYESLYIK